MTIGSIRGDGYGTSGRASTTATTALLTSEATGIGVAERVNGGVTKMLAKIGIVAVLIGVAIRLGITGRVDNTSVSELTESDDVTSPAITIGGDTLLVVLAGRDDLRSHTHTGLTCPAIAVTEDTIAVGRTRGTGAPVVTSPKSVALPALTSLFDTVIVRLALVSTLSAPISGVSGHLCATTVSLLLGP